MNKSTLKLMDLNQVCILRTSKEGRLIHILSKMPAATKRTKVKRGREKGDRRCRLNEDEEAKRRRLEDKRIRQQQYLEAESVEGREVRLEDKRIRQQQAR